MKTKLFYYFILFVYVSLWICQLIACHLTHSLIILTDSYINLYRIFDISLGILHLSTQQSLATNNGALSTDCSNGGKSGLIVDSNSRTLAYKFFATICTYQYKRLPLLGSFVNGMFLAALLMSAAIEGLQTCIHVQHSENRDQKTILTEDATTYPIILVGFALVGLIMQYCSLKAHEMREEELCSESLLDLRAKPIEKCCESNEFVSIKIKELDASGLVEMLHTKHANPDRRKRHSYDLNLHRQLAATTIGVNQTNEPSSLRSGSKQSLREIPLRVVTSELPIDETSRVSMKSLRYSVDTASKAVDDQMSFGREADQKVSLQSQFSSRKLNSNRDIWFHVRCLASPVAMLICSVIFYLVDVELVTEISDAALAVSVVFLLFAASFPPMKKAGKILLQTVPDGVDLEKLRSELSLCSRNGQVLEVKDLHVWSLTPRSNRVATCRLVLDKSKIVTEGQLKQIMEEAKFKFLDQHIKCVTIQPELISAGAESGDHADG